MPLKPLANEDYSPSFAGFAILEYTNPSGDAVDAQSLWKLEYSPLGSVCSTGYNTNYIYRFALKVEYPVGEVVPGIFPPSVFAILYSGDQREDDTMVLPLVSAGIGPDKTSPIPSMVYNTDMTTIRINSKIQMQQQNPDGRISNYFYGFLQLDYHYTEITYEIGTHTIEFMLGWGPVEAQPNTWTDVMKCQWQITPPTATDKSGTAQKKTKTAGKKKGHR
jgi:hypothetical protein